MNSQAESAVSAPLAPPLQVDQAMMALHDAVTANTAAVQELLKRLAPVSQRGFIIGSLTITAGSFSTGSTAESKEFRPSKAPLAEAIDARRTSIDDLTKEVQAATAALQI